MSEHAHPHAPENFNRVFAIGVTLNVIYVLTQVGFGIFAAFARPDCGCRPQPRRRSGSRARLGRELPGYAASHISPDLRMAAHFHHGGIA